MSELHSPGENGAQPRQEVNCQPAIVITRVLRRDRYLFVLCLFAVEGFGRSSDFDSKVLAIASAAGLGLSVVHLALRGAVRSVALFELLCASIALAWASWMAWKVARFEVRSNDFPSLVGAMLFAASAAYCCHRIISPGAADLSGADLLRILCSTAVEERRIASDPMKMAAWAAGLVLLSALAVYEAPEGREGSFALLLIGAGSLYWLSSGTIPALWMLRHRTTLLPSRPRRIGGYRGTGYWRFVFLNSTKRVRSAAYGGAAMFLLLIYLLIFGGDPHRAVENFGPSLVPLWIATFLFRKARTTLKSGVRWTDLAARWKERGSFILYLRSFEDDDFYFDAIGDLTRLFYVPFAFTPIFSDYVRAGKVTVEAVIVRALWPCRPVLSVAPPVGQETGATVERLEADTRHVPATDSLQRRHEHEAQKRAAKLPATAARLRLSPGTWQQDVLDLARKAERVILVAAGTSGLQWEFDTLSREPDLRRRVILLIPPETGGGVLDRWFALSHSLRTVPSNDLSRVLAIRLAADSRDDVLFLANERSAVAYTVALRLAQMPPHTT